MTTARILAPAYALNSRDHADRAHAQARRLATDLDWTVSVDPLVDRIEARGRWLPLADRVTAWTAAVDQDWRWTVRGGYGSLELVTALAAADVHPAGRLLGYSDVTALHAWWWRHAAGPTCYGPNADTACGPRAWDSLLGRVCGRPLQVDSAACPSLRGLRSGRAEGRCFAGCLRVLTSLVGGPWCPDLRGCLVCIEDVDERPYAVDRDLRQLHAAGVLDGIVGLIGSGFPHTPAKDYGGPDHGAILAHWADRLAVPAALGLPFGHDPDPLTVGIGWAGTLQVEASGAVAFDQRLDATGA